MSTTFIPDRLAALIGAAADMQGAILIYRNDVVVFANEEACRLHPQQDWSKPVTFDGIFRAGIAFGRIADRAILADPDGHLAYAKMARARELSFRFRRLYDGVPYDRYHTGLDSEWNAQIWLKVERSLLEAGDLEPVAPDLLAQVRERRALGRMNAVLEQMGVSVATVAVDGQLLDCSPRMARCIGEGELFACDDRGFLMCRSAGSTLQLRRSIAAVAQGLEPAALVPVPDDDATLPVAVLPASGRDRTAFVVVHEAVQAEALQDILVSAYGLTKPQAEVVVRLSVGETPDDIAVVLNRKPDTVRRQIATSKAKIAVGRQHDLARIVTRASALFGGISSPTTRKGKQ